MDNHSSPQKEVRQARESERIVYRKNKYAAPVGGLYILLAVIGLIAVGAFCVQFTRSLLDNTAEKQKFEQIITPVVMFDPIPFETVSEADPLFLLRSSLWSALLGEKRDSYEFNELNLVVVPASDVDVACARLYGAEVKLQHQSFGDYINNYIYREDTKTYEAPVTAQTDLFTPSVERVVKKGDVFTLTVGYLLPSNAWTQTKTGETGKPEPNKYMLYELKKVKDHYQITAIRDVPRDSVGSEATRLGLTDSSSEAAAQSSASQAEQ